MKNIGAFINKRSGWILLGGFAFIIISVIYGTTLFSKLNSAGFQVAGSDSYAAFNAVHERLPNTEPELIVLFSD